MDRMDCYKFTNRMPKRAGRDEAFIRANNQSEDIDKIRQENAELKAMVFEMRQSVNALLANKAQKAAEPEEDVEPEEAVEPKKATKAGKTEKANKTEKAE